MAQIIAVIGLGNPGPKFTHTRHNIGFRILDELALRHNTQFTQQGSMETAEIDVHGHPVLLVKPLTYMNKSGQVYPLLRKKGIKPENVLTIHDELEKSLCTLTLRKTGSHKGHNGLRSLIEHMGTPEFFRLGFGVGRPISREPDVVGAYVLSRFTPQEEQQLPECINNAVQQIYEIIEKEHPGGKLG